jgi:hypothetical protein
VPDDLRPEVVAALTEPQQLPAELVDQVLDATDAERQAAAGALLEQTRALLEQAGVLRPSVGIMDLSYRSAVAITAAFGTVQGVWSQPAYQDRPLGDILKVVGADQTAWAVAVLRWGGLLPPEEE